MSPAGGLSSLQGVFAETAKGNGRPFLDAPADDAVVVVEGRDHSVAASGHDSPNRCCWIFVMRDGKVAEATEYTDTQLIAEVLAPPPAAR
ncbi:nuclear transport factor 2 family protein [Streptosporangium pseudovulgare]|uniref:SnoaL-like domain-containing protein n=1 Tax=Streptosporangium pseudovulgare TaxID=35765 RepID=A0ABQ2QN73_9ACTN|nr:hypothetical protein [Streptosporangium pseudovulgare]GGP89069.1 hypothetical protein GCM10010140_18600 [Streptosporangium pseudovulgare]